MTRSFNGWHMTAIMVAFFGIVIAVNVEMAALAGKTFGGTVVDNGYVASQKFNAWLAEARAQKAQRWSLATTIAPDRRVDLKLTVTGEAVTHARIDAVLRHPLGQVPEQPVRFVEAGDGVYRSTILLPAGRWQIHFEVHGARGTAYFDDEIPA